MEYSIVKLAFRAFQRLFFVFLWYLVAGFSEAVVYMYVSVLIDIVEQTEYFSVTSCSEFPGFVLYMADMWVGKLGSEHFEEFNLSGY